VGQRQRSRPLPEHRLPDRQLGARRGSLGRHRLPPLHRGRPRLAHRHRRLDQPGGHPRHVPLLHGSPVGGDAYPRSRHQTPGLRLRVRLVVRPGGGLPGPPEHAGHVPAGRRRPGGPGLAVLRGGLRQEVRAVRGRAGPPQAGLPQVPGADARPCPAAQRPGRPQGAGRAGRRAGGRHAQGAKLALVGRAGADEAPGAAAGGDPAAAL